MQRCSGSASCTLEDTVLLFMVADVSCARLRNVKGRRASVTPHFTAKLPANLRATEILIVDFQSTYLLVIVSRFGTTTLYT